jgi:hypothetical protein
MSDAERAEYDAAAVEAEARLQLAELVYNALTAAGLSQTELARGGWYPPGRHLRHQERGAGSRRRHARGIAHALGGTLEIRIAA